MPDHDVCVVGKIYKLPYPKRAEHSVKHPFEMVFTELMGRITSKALGSFKYVSKISGQYTKWTATYLLKSKGDVISIFQSLVQYLVFSDSSCIEHLKADEGGGYGNKDFKDNCL